MLSSLYNWRTVLAFVAILIVSGTIFYSQYLAGKIAVEEKQKVLQRVEAGKLLVNDTSGISTQLVGLITADNNSIPIIQTDENDVIVAFVNLDSLRAAEDPAYLDNKLREFKAINEPVEWISPNDSTQINRYYFGPSRLLNEVRYYPIVQLMIIGLFIIITILALRSNYRSQQNQVWAGMAKETAHQLGTPVSSLEGWAEVLKEQPVDKQIVSEIQKDIERLKLVSDRFGKIGSIPHQEPSDIIILVNNMVDYIRKRAGMKVQFTVQTSNLTELIVPVSPPLFDWVIENLLKNALDAMEGRGSITIDIKNAGTSAIIDVSDTGKGITKNNHRRVFSPGFTTKKRGWGLGLSLTKRIIEQYHKGEIFVKHS
ncbi:MAG TPA: HAMP domain-containing sensor histidine kinase, partial [Parasegetibacter sp.]